MRDVGKYFSVNRMLSAESIKQGLERGLSFIEFNYMLLQAYDFWHLYKHDDCSIQMGGSDQWGNIVAGIDLVRRMEGQQAYGITFPLLTTSSGRKMGKTEQGTVWLDAERTSPYEYYQFWVNAEDPDVTKFLALFTLLPIEEIRAVETLEGADLNIVKKVLAFEATVLAHGMDAAIEAHEASGIFGAKEIPKDILPSSSVPRVIESGEALSVPTTAIAKGRFEEGINACELFVEVGLCQSRGEARRLITQGGAYCNEERVASHDRSYFLGDVGAEGLLLRKGKKVYHRVIIEE